MALMIDGKVFRNLEEQVQKNKEDIANHYAIDRALANFGIKIVGTVSTPEQLPDPLTYSGEYGDGYAVGEPGAYVYYIYTRPDLNSGHSNNYWLDVGAISVVGPEGPQGPQGVPGPEGKSIKWYTGEYQPSNPNVGDMYLNNQGQVFQYSENNVWLPVSNIRGPQGIQGIQGIQGPVGPVGPQGIQGLRGDVGGFISIAGILSSEGQLPTPLQLGNLTLAYLVGTVEPYDLYIQIGETSEEATWNNVGPLNVATMVTVNGQFQNTWDADTKLDKITSTGNNRVYTVSEQGIQGSVNYGSTAVAGYIPVYEPGQGGALQVGTPVKDVHAVNKTYLETELNKKVSKVTPTANATYAYSVVKNNENITESITEVSTSSRPRSIPLRGANGNFYIGEPADAGQCASKRYVDNMWEKIYPVGSIYMNVNQVDPSLLFGGTWEQIKDKFLLASGDIYANGSEGGSADAVVVNHYHTGTAYTTISGSGSHTHGIYGNIQTDLGDSVSTTTYNKSIQCDDTITGTIETLSDVATIYTQSSGEHTHTASTDIEINSNGVNGTGKNLPPYIAVNVWKRTA